MGIYINTEMPKSCGECLEIGWHYVFECNLDDVEDGEKLATCPLVHVPPHGRCIDADALTISTAVPLDGKPYQYVHIDNIDDAPTIIPAEEASDVRSRL